MELFVFVIDSKVMNSPGIRLESLGEAIFKHKSHVPKLLKKPTVNFLKDILFKNYCTLLKIGKTTPQCPKQLPDDEYTGESCLACGQYIGESRHPCDEYTGESIS